MKRHHIGMCSSRILCLRVPGSPGKYRFARGSLVVFDSTANRAGTGKTKFGKSVNLDNNAAIRSSEPANRRASLTSIKRVDAPRLFIKDFKSAEIERSGSDSTTAPSKSSTSKVPGSTDWRIRTSKQPNQRGKLPTLPKKSIQNKASAKIQHSPEIL